MYKIEKTNFGVKLTFEDFIKRDEMAKWVEESKQILRTVPSKFGVLVDMRNLKPLPQDAQNEMEKGQKLYKEKGMQRSAVVVANTLIALQFKRIAKETGIYEWERYIDASRVQNWEEIAIKWIVKAEDPDK